MKFNWSHFDGEAVGPPIQVTVQQTWWSVIVNTHLVFLINFLKLN